jgi:5'-nucleotidase
MRIVLTNDDGIEAPGLIALYEAIRDLGEVHVVAPATVQSAMGHAVTFHRPMTTMKRSIRSAEGLPLFDGIAVDGKPADCVKLALRYLVPGPVDLVISGMNGGANVGVNVHYSGTVGAAREAAIRGIRAMAVSLHLGKGEGYLRASGRTRWRDAAAHARDAINHLLAGPHSPHTLLNLNVPITEDDRPHRGLRVVPLSLSPLTDDYDCRPDDKGNHCYHAVATMTFMDMPVDTDVHALFERYLTVTPIRVDAGEPALLQQWSQHVDSAPREVPA